MMSPEGDGPRRIDVFFYGLFMDVSLLREKGLNPVDPRRAHIDDFQLIIGERATLLPSVGQTAYGVLFALTHDEIDRLYSEPSVLSYRPEAVIAVSEEGQPVPALCFNLTSLDFATERNTEYAAKLRDVATRLNLPKSYVDSI